MTSERCLIRSALSKDDASRLEKTKIRLINLRKNKSLLEITAEKITEGFDHYFPEKDGKIKPPNIPINLQEKILRKMCLRSSGDFERLIDLLWLLLSPQTKNVSLLNLVSFDQQTDKLVYKKLMKNLATRAPNIRALKIESNVIDQRRKFVLDQKFIGSIGKLEKLTFLEIFPTLVNLSDLKKLCEGLKNLSHVDVIINFDCLVFSDVEGIKRSFSHLKSFLFRHHPAEDMDSLANVHRLTNTCIQHLPNLQNVGNSFLTPLRCVLEEDLPAVPSQLRHLSTYPGPLDLLPVFPHLQSLMVAFEADRVYDEPEICPLLRFPRIEKLCLRNLQSGQILDQFLKTYGTNLTLLRIETFSGRPISVNVKSTLATCPQLETLILRNVDLSDSQEIDHFAQLKDFHWWSNTSEKTMALSYILSAPNLEYISVLSSSALDAGDLNKVSSLIAKNRILKKLCALHFCCNNDDSLVALADLMKNASAHLPKLAYIRLDTEMSTAIWRSVIEPSALNTGVNDSAANFANFFRDFSLFFNAYGHSCFPTSTVVDNLVRISMEGYIHI